MATGNLYATYFQCPATNCEGVREVGGDPVLAAERGDGGLVQGRQGQGRGHRGPDVDHARQGRRRALVEQARISVQI